MTRQWWLGVVCVLALASVLLARPGVVKTKDGQSIEGDIDEAPDTNTVSVTVHGVKTTLARSSVDSITYTGSLDEQFQARMKKLAPTDVAGRIDLARWAFDNRQYELARQADDSALKIDQHNPDALSLMTTIQSTLAMEARRNATPPPAPAPIEVPPKPVVGEPNPPEPAAGSPKLLSADDINTIRQNEMQSADANARVKFNNKVVERYLSTGDKNVARFNAMPTGSQAMEIIATGDANLIKDVKILTDPASLLEFRRTIQPRVLAGCAASGCHGGPGGGSFYLYTNADQTAAWYTNFYILQTYTTKVAGGGGLGGGGDVTRSMIDRTQPESSLLVQFGLPVNVAMTPHPKAPGLKPMFLTSEDPTYQEIVRWEGSSLKPFAPDYGIKYELPTGKSSTQPSSTQPAE